ncbi:MAG: hypothetical protein QM488_05685, partial [Rhizobiaceae bacterium]
RDVETAIPTRNLDTIIAECVAKILKKESSKTFVLLSCITLEKSSAATAASIEKYVVAKSGP